ncbi:MAG: hypothetical protein D6743_13880 [Calditrichaeota bacterium]|nr:MAG: hypothetical protein D6743_13880 [Calditrichota bacterium]
MNEIPPVNPTAQQDLFGTTNSVLGKDDFLKILVTQLRHQDPVNPIKSEEFAAQLAQFSSVEQLNNINTNLENSNQLDLLLNQAINNTMATTLIGHSVRALGNFVSLKEDGSVYLNYNLAGQAREVTLTVRDESGDVVRTVTLSNVEGGDRVYRWDGKDDEGKRLPAGRYSFSVQATDASGNAVDAQTFVAGVIDSIRYQDGNAILLLNGGEVNLADVVEIGNLTDDPGNKVAD